MSTLVATLVGAAVAALTSWLLVRREARRRAQEVAYQERQRSREERIQAVSGVISADMLAWDALFDKKVADEAIRMAHENHQPPEGSIVAALKDARERYVQFSIAASGALMRLNLVLTEPEEIITKALTREYLWMNELPLDEMSNRSQLARELLRRWAKNPSPGNCASFQIMYDAAGPSRHEGPETPETVPNRSRPARSPGDVG